MTRRYGTTLSHSTPEPVDTTVEPATWLAAQMGARQLPWLLAFTSEGVVWGELRADGLHRSTGPDAFPRSGPPALRWDELEWCRCFSEAGELFVWVGPHGPAAHLRMDTSGAEVEYLEEEYQLWGEGRELRDGFVRLVEGEQGIAHCPPLNRAVSPTSRARLLVRHYLEEDVATGAVRVAISRLVGISQAPGAAMPSAQM